MIDFIQDYCDKSERLQEDFDLDDCYFIVKKSPNYNTKCLFIVDNSKNKEEQISLERFGNPPKPIVNFRSFCTYTIMEFKKEHRIILSQKKGKNYNEHDLWHKKPTTKEIVDEFIAIKGIADKLDQIISPNGSGFNVPILMSGYEYLKQEFIDFYQSKAATELNFELKPRK